MTTNAQPDPESQGDPVDGVSEDQKTTAQLFTESLTAAATRAGIGQVTPGEAPSARSLLRAIGGVRGLVESLLPGVGFLVIYTITKQVLPSVLAPLALSVVFILVRALTRSPVMPAVAGAFGVAVSAGLALFTGRAEDNFVLGIIINGVSIAVLLISLLVRWPLIGVIAGLLTSDVTGWRADRAKVRVVTVATWCWVGLFAARLSVQLPLYLSGQVELLGSLKLIMGLPLYALMLWVTWLLVRTAFGGRIISTSR